MSAPKAKQPAPLERVLEVLGGYGLACTILLLLFLLTFLGTLEQTESGLFEVQKRYFESLFLVHWVADKIPIPLPGVFLLLIALTVNLVLGGLVRIRKSRHTAGVIVIHVGILMMLAAGFVKTYFSVDGHLTLFEHDASDEFVSYHEWEVAVWDASQRRDVQEFVISEDRFRGLDPAGERTVSIQDPALPLRLTFSRFVENAEVLPASVAGERQPAVDGFAVRELKAEKENEQNLAALYVKAEGGAEGILWGRARYPWLVEAGGKTWAVDLRRKRFKLPFTIVLDEFAHEMHPGTGMAKAFRSNVTKLEGGSTQHILIEMNEPLRHEGYTLFQASWGPANARPGDPLFSTFAVVRNPSDYWPLYSCIVVTVGLCLAFGQKLYGYIKAQQRKRELDA